MKNFMNKIKAKANSLAIRAKSTIDNARAEGYIDTGVKIIIGVVVGAVILGGLYALFNDGQDEKGKSCRITGTPKTETSKRIIPIPKQLIPHLREIKKRSTSKYVVGNGSKIITVRSY